MTVVGTDDDAPKKPRFGFGKLAETLKNARSGQVDVDKLTPEQRAKYEAVMARNEAAIKDAEAQWQLAERLGEEARDAQVIQGPARQPPPLSAAEVAAMARGDGREAAELTRRQMRDLGAATRSAIEPATLRRVFYETFLEMDAPDGRSPEQRAELAAVEFEARQAAQAPYHAAGMTAPVITRFMTSGSRQYDDVTSFLVSSGLAARPDLVYGVYRVPDRISPHVNSTSERGPVEWEVVHDPDIMAPAVSSTSSIERSRFERAERWIARRVGETAPVDEDMAAYFCEMAAIGPDHCFGFNREMKITSRGVDSVDLQPRINGVVVWYRPTPAASAARQHLEQQRPVLRPPAPPPIHLEILDWRSIAQHVHAFRTRPPMVPSPMPHLPGSPQELMLGYLRVVGVRPNDCFSASVTVAAPSEETGTGPKLPCVDGQPRRRFHFADVVVIGYRDSPGSVAGRERWAAYQRDVLMARLTDATSRRDVVEVQAGWERALDRVGRVIDFFDIDATEPRRVPFPYCWPPVDI